MHRLPLVRRRTPPGTRGVSNWLARRRGAHGRSWCLESRVQRRSVHHFGSDSAKRVFTVLLLSLAVALCFSLPGCLPSVLHQVSGLLLLPGPRAPWFHSPLMLAHGSNLTVCSQGPWPLSHRIQWSFSRAPSGQDPHRQTPQGALDRSRSFLACQDFGIPAVFILRQVLTVRIPRTPLVLKSPTEFPCSRLGSPARSSPVHSCGTLSSPTRSSRRPGQDILRECFTGPVQPGFQARRVPRCLS